MGRHGAHGRVVRSRGDLTLAPLSIPDPNPNPYPNPNPTPNPEPQPSRRLLDDSNQLAATISGAQRATLLKLIALLHTQGEDWDSW